MRFVSVFRCLGIAAIILRAGLAAADAAPLNTCGETVADAVLTADLDCSAASGFAVTIVNDGRLDLAGHRLTGTATFGTSYQEPDYGGAVKCIGKCTVIGGGGAIVAPPGLPAQTWFSFGVYSPLYDANGRYVLSSRLTISDVEISGWPGLGVVASRIDIRNSTVTGNAYGLNADRTLLMDNCVVADNTLGGAHVSKGTISNSTFTGNRGAAIYLLRRLRFINSLAIENQDQGLLGGKLLATESTIVDNCTSPSSVQCFDIFSRARPRLVNSTCGTSSQEPAGESWNVCTLD